MPHFDMFSAQRKGSATELVELAEPFQGGDETGDECRPKVNVRMRHLFGQ